MATKLTAGADAVRPQNEPRLDSAPTVVVETIRQVREAIQVMVAACDEIELVLAGTDSRAEAALREIALRAQEGRCATTVYDVRCALEGIHQIASSYLPPARRARGVTFDA